MVNIFLQVSSFKSGNYMENYIGFCDGRGKVN